MNMCVKNGVQSFVLVMSMCVSNAGAVVSTGGTTDLICPPTSITGNGSTSCTGDSNCNGKVDATTPPSSNGKAYVPGVKETSTASPCTKNGKKDADKEAKEDFNTKCTSYCKDHSYNKCEVLPSVLYSTTSGLSSGSGSCVSTSSGSDWSVSVTKNCKCRIAPQPVEE